MQIIANTDVGLVRRRNEDFFVLDEAHHLAIVCDGMGGHPGGDVASRMAAEGVQQAVKEGSLDDFKLEPSQDQMAEEVKLFSRLLSGIFWADRRLRDHGNKNPEYNGMGTTIVALQEIDGYVCIAHVGDSRVYAVTGDEFEQVTHDHSVVATNPEYANFKSMRNILTRAMGVGEALEADFTIRAVRAGVSYALCTDGLTNFVADSRISEILRSDLKGEEKISRLINEAKKSGGGDNITLAIVTFDEDSSREGCKVMGSVVQQRDNLEVKIGSGA